MGYGMSHGGAVPWAASSLRSKRDRLVVKVVRYVGESFILARWPKIGA